MDSRHRTWVSSERFVPKTFISPFVRFSQIEASSGIVLLIAAIVAMVWANSGWADSYFSLLEQHLTIEFGSFQFDESVLHLINDGLMAVFFFVVGLEIKRELVLGDLRDPKAAALPVLAALGGMVVPALIYLVFNAGTAAGHGWGIPMATDIAFAVGIVALLGSRVPAGAKLFLLAVAIADDIGAIAVIAIFYTSELNAAYLAAAVAGLIAVWIASKIHVRAMWFYVPAAFLIWYFTLESGVHATIAGVALGFLTPAYPYYGPREFDERARAILDQFDPDDITDLHAQEHADHEALLLSDIASESVSPLTRMEYKLVRWSSFVIVPLFALANAGVDFRGVDIGAALTSNIALGVAGGLVIGKIVGISAAAFGAVRLGLGRLPPGTSWGHVVGLAAIAGIGFTVALFVAGLAFEEPEFTNLAKVGIFSGSIVAGIIGSIILSRAKPRSEL
ncbi:MAG TPA: Na+/H+ antiporter NhaA [Acidimicrobiia bacterium]|nr:Na+/H+ antiporter NhaA [Acidimicrobiia bacterium]